MAQHRVEMNGTLVLPLGPEAGYAHMVILGGPFDTSLHTGDTYRINLKAEGTRKHFDAELPIKDYSVPTELHLVKEIIEDAIVQSLAGKIIVTGCMGGMGRTGLFLAILAKAVGITDPVTYVRKHYYNLAVETPEQEDYIEDFDVSWVKNAIATTYNRMHAPATYLLPSRTHDLIEAPRVPSLWERFKRFWTYSRA